MATHGTERDGQRRHDLIKTDLMFLGTRIQEVEDQISAMNRRLDELSEATSVTDRRFGIWGRRRA